MPAASLRALLAGAIDYAGLFPPATLDLEPALENYAEYVRSADAWMLGTFVLPIAKFDEAANSLPRFDPANRLRVSALGLKTETPAQFIRELENTAKAIRAFRDRHGTSTGIDQIEMALPAQAGVLTIETDRIVGGLQLPVFWEAPADDAERVIDSIAARNRSAASGGLGFKLRTGGVIASAFPSSIQIARALVAAA